MPATETSTTPMAAVRVPPFANSGQWLAIAGIVAFLALFLIIPVAMVILVAFQDPATGQFTLINFVDFAGNDLFRRSFANSIYVSAMSVVWASALALPLALTFVISALPLPVAGPGAQFGALSFFLGVGLALTWCLSKLWPHRALFLVDALWRDAGVIVEADSRRFHDIASARRDDARRDRALGARGYRVLRATHDEIVERPATTAARISRALDRLD